MWNSTEDFTQAVLCALAESKPIEATVQAPVGILDMVLIEKT